MKCLDRSKSGATIAFSRDELGIVSNALNYVCNAIALPEFSSVIGASPRDANALLDALGVVLKAKADR